MIALLAEPIRAWSNGSRVILLGIKTSIKDGFTSENAVTIGEDGKIETWRDLDSIVTEWQWDPKKSQWADVSEPAENDEDE